MKRSKFAYDRAKNSLVNKRFKSLVVIDIGYSDKPGIMCVCRCDCGKMENISRHDLLNGHRTSCGCNPGYRTHGLSETPTYRSWRQMRYRCRSKKYTSHKSYADRNITFCERWNSFENFLADMGERPNGKSLDRIDNDKGYSPDNCRWATPTEQMHNTRYVRWITHNGQTKPMNVWAREMNIACKVLSQHLSRHPVEKAFELASHSRSRFSYSGS